MGRTDARPRAARARARSWVVALALLTTTLWVGALEPTPAEAAADGTRGKIAGYGVTTSSGGDKVVAAEAERMAAPGINMVSLEATWAVSGRAGNNPQRTAATVRDEDLLLAARRVREAGMNVMMTVKVSCEGSTCTANGWRGVLEPSDRQEFFRNYRAMSNHYADLARQAGAAIYFVGSEMNSLQRETAQWRQVILEARQRFSGSIGYQTNWDLLSGAGFWDEVDIAGVSAYFPLSDEMQPNISDLLAAWRDSDTEAHRGSDWYSQLREFAASHGKPVLFGEIGYQSARQAGQRPYFKDKFDGEDEQLQADLYQTALTLFEDEPWWLGAVWWEYINTSTYREDYDYSPRGKLAEELLTKWYANQRPASRERSLVGTTRPSAKADGEPPATGPAKPPASGIGASAPKPPPRTAAATPGTAPRSAASAQPAPGPTQASAAPLPSAVAPPPVLPSLAVPSTGTEVLGARPPLPEVLDELDVQTVDDALARAAEREHRERMSVAAAALLAPLLLGHGVQLFRRMRRPAIFSR